ncbi:hypothetical protein ABQF26_08000 [Mycolicibacterium elephantis]
MTGFSWLTGLICIHLVSLVSIVSALASSHVAGLRGGDRLEGFKDGLLFGPIGLAVVTFRKARVPDIAVVCPHCKTRQDVDGTLKWFECWQCEERSDIPASPPV